VPTVAPSQSKGKVGLLIGLGVLLVGFVVVAVVGVLIYTKMKPGPAPTPTTNQSTTVPPATPTEVAQYWLELQPKSESEQPTQVAGLVPIASGQSMRFHFNFNEDGYLYVFGPGKNNAPTAFLTAKPFEATGWKTNKVSKGSGQAFPTEFGVLQLDARPGTDTFTVIFSKTQLKEPSFLNSEVTGDALTGSDQSDLRAFVGKYGKAPVTELDQSNPKAQFVRVKVKGDELNNPIAFEIRIQHN
jgi:hypothetical protein